MKPLIASIIAFYYVYMSYGETISVSSDEIADTSLRQGTEITISPSDTLRSLDRMVVSATRTRRRIRETPASVTLISRKEIATSPAKDINDLVANKTGIVVRRSVGMGEGVPSDIAMRGIPGTLAATRTLILVDGIPTNASGTPFLILNEIPVEIIDNIEIVRGPYSSLYGANAFGGVINVITEKGYGSPGLSGTFETSYPFSMLERWHDGEQVTDAVSTGARQALWNGNVYSRGGNETFHYLVNAGYRYIGNYLLNDSALVKIPDLEYRIPARNYDYADLRLFGKFGWQLNENLSAELHTRYFNSDLGFGVTRYADDGDTNDISMTGEKIIAGPQVLWKASESLDIKAGGFIRFVNGSYMDEIGGRQIAWESNTVDWQLDLQSIFRPVHGHVIAAGAEFLSNGVVFGDLVDDKDSVVSEGVDDRISNAGAYIQDEMILFDRLRIVPGIRMDYHTLFKAALSPKLGASLKVNDRVHLRGSAGRAFRAPNHAELFMPPVPIVDTIPLESNRHLDPEYIWAFDLGVDVTPCDNIRLQTGGFYNSMRDMIGQGITLKSIDPVIVAVTHENISSAWSAGIEFEGEWQPVRSLTFSGGYALQWSRNESASEVAEYFKKWGIGSVTETALALDYIPRHKGSVGVRYQRTFGKVTLSITGDELITGTRHYLNFSQVRVGGVSSDIDIDPNTLEVKVCPPYQELPAYFRTDFLLRGDYGRVFGTIALQNLFNAEYEEAFGTFAPGRLATMKIGVQF